MEQSDMECDAAGTNISYAGILFLSFFTFTFNILFLLDGRDHGN